MIEKQVKPVDHGKCQELFKPFDSDVTERMVCVTGEHDVAWMITKGMKFGPCSETQR